MKEGFKASDYEMSKHSKLKKLKKKQKRDKHYSERYLKRFCSVTGV